jgi:hypothetical protein
MWEWLTGIGTGIGALTFLIVGIAGGVELRRKSRLLATMNRTPTSRIRNAQPGLVELAGVAVSAGELVTAPLTGAPCVYFRVAVDEPAGSSRSGVLDDAKWCDFYVDDGSGAVARLSGTTIHVKTATRVLDTEHADAVQRLLTARGISTIAKDVEQLTWFEERIDVGTPIYVLGEARRAPPRPANGAYRGDAARERFIVVAPEGGELVVSVGSEEALAAKLRSELSIGRMLLAICAVSAVAFTVVLVVLLAR